MGWGKIKRRFKRAVKRVASSPVVQAVAPYTALAAGAAGGKRSFVRTARSTGATQLRSVGPVLSLYNPTAGAVVSGAVEGSGIADQVDNPPPSSDRLRDLPTQGEARGYATASDSSNGVSSGVMIAAAIGAAVLGVLIWKAASK